MDQNCTKKVMKIGILTLPIDVNYGGILQGYALKTILEREGHVVLFLNLRYTPIPLYLRFLVYCKKLIYSYLWGQGRITNKEWKYVSHSVTDFASRYMVFTRSLYNSTDLRNELKKKELDAIIYGSDQIWSRHYSPNLECYFGSFLTESEKIKQLSYAASFGSSCGADYPKEQLDFYRCLLKRFVAVSVREKSGVDICKEYFNVDAEQLLDPTLLLDADDYRKLISAALTRPSKGNLHVYILDETNEKIDLVNRIAKERNLIPFYSNVNFLDIHKSIEERCLFSVEQWLRSFDDASFIITDSFHGCIFSILFRKNFIAIGNVTRGIERFFSLLDLFSLRERLILSCEEYDSKKKGLQNDIDFDMVYSKLFKYREHAFSFVKTYCKK